MNFLTETNNMQDLVRQVDDVLTEIDKRAKRGIVAVGFLANSDNSFLFTDGDGVLKYYDADTKTTSTVTLS